jgi:hypothetical protein
MKALSILFFCAWSLTVIAGEPDQSRIPGVKTIVVTPDSILITHDDESPFQLSNGNADVKSLAVAVGTSFYLSDGHHVGFGYRLLDINDDSARLEAMAWTNFPGRDETRSSHTILVRPYGAIVPRTN